jgi:ferredoxin
VETIPYRDSYWNIPLWLRVVMFACMAVSLAVMAYGVWQRARLWRKGRPAAGFDRPGPRLARTFRYAGAQVRVAREAYPAVMHFSIFGAMVLLFLGTVLATIDTDIFEFLLDSKLLQGDFYLLYKLVLDLATLFGFIGLALAVYRRYWVKPTRLNTDWRYNLTFPLLAFILLTGLLVEAFRLAAVQPPWGPWSVVGYPVSLLFLGLSEPTLLGIHRMLWSVHFLGVAALFAVRPHTNLLHIFTSPANIFVAPFRERGALHPIGDLETAEQLGASHLTDFPWPRLVNLDACTECGRCQEACPRTAEQPLNLSSWCWICSTISPSPARSCWARRKNRPGRHAPW